MQNVSILETNTETAPSPHSQPSTLPELSWHGEFPLGGSANDIAIARNADGRLEVFYAGTENHLYHNWQLAPNSLFWSGETAFSGESALQIAVATNTDGRLEIFYVGTNNDLYHNWQTAPNTNSWKGETAFPGVKATEVCVAQNADGRLEIFYRGTENHLYHNWQLAPNSTSWKGETVFNGDSALQIAAARNADGRLEIFYVGTKNDLYHNWQTAPNATAWKGETAFPNAKANEVEVAQNADGRLEIFYRGTGNHLYHNWQLAPNSTNWQGETPFPNAAADQIAVAANADGRLEIFYVGTENHLYHNWQTTANTNSWAGETAFKGNSANQVVAARNADGRLEIFYRGTENHLSHNWQTQFTGFGSNANYIFSNNCKPITGLTVTINVSQDIICQAANGSYSGFSFQLNAYSPKNQKNAWQQYCFVLNGTQLLAVAENWPINGDNLFNDHINLLSFPSAKLPAKYQLSITLQNDSNSNITGATYVVLDAAGKTVANLAHSLTSHGFADLAPIIAFELNLVAAFNGEAALLSSGAGTFSYKADTALVVLTALPSCAEIGYTTAETANTVYASVTAATAATPLTQTFNITSNESQFKLKAGSVGPGLTPPPAQPTTGR